MRNSITTFLIIIFCCLLPEFNSISHATNAAQRTRKQAHLACKKEAFAALKPLPKLTYRCNPNENDYDTKILKRAPRRAALQGIISQLEEFTDENWWSTSVEELNRCYFHKKPGDFSKSEQHSFESDEYKFQLFGNNEIRLILVKDPCYQIPLGRNGFILYRKDNIVYVTQILDGYFSRTDNPISMNFAAINDETIIEISSLNGVVYPITTNYYFTIDKMTNKAIPKNLFRVNNKLTNTISTEDISLYDDNEEAYQMIIIKKGKLRKTFSTFTRAYPNNETDPKYSAIAYKWNGKYFAPAK